MGGLRIDLKIESRTWIPCALSLLLVTLGTHVASAGDTGKKPITTYGPGEALMTLYGSAPRERWGANGYLEFTTMVGGKPQTRYFDPASGKSIIPTAGKKHLQSGSAVGKPRIVAPGLMSYSPPVREVQTRDGEWLAGTHDGNLYLRRADSAQHERYLTHDGTARDGYTVLGARWSPDGRFLAVRRMNARDVPTIPIVDWISRGQAVVRKLYSRVGDPLVRQTLVLADRRAGKTAAVALDPSLAYLHPVSWSPDSRYLYLVATTRLMKRIELVRIDATTGKTKHLLTEKSSTNIDGSQSYLFVRGYAPQLTSLHYVTVLKDGRFIWTSERDGWRRLYLYDADGTLVRPLTPPEIVVQRVVDYDAAHETVYYVAQARKNRPYRNALFSVSLDHGSPVRIAYGPEFFQIRMRSDGRYLVLVHGGLAAAPTMDVYDRHGTHIKRIWSAQALMNRFRQGRTEAFVVKAADGKTRIHGLLFKPADFDPNKKYPVVELIYGGPQEGIIAHWQAGPNYWMGQALASAGFVAVEIDARGSPGRGRAFANAFYGRIGQGVIADHVAALHEAASSRPWMDLSRVGVVGHSWGGYYAARALLEAPDTYRAAVASAGPADLRDFRAPIEPYMGCLPKQCPDAYDKGSNTALVDGMQGKLMIMQGTADRDVPFGESMRLIAALEKAGKSYQYAAFPGSPHTIYNSTYWWRRIAGFFKQNLGAAR